MIRLRRVVVGLVLAGGVVALAAGPHPITATYFNQTGGRELEVWYSGPDIEEQKVPSAILAHTGTGQAAADAPVTPVPRQLAWQDMEFIAFVHFGMNTFTDREWGEGKGDRATYWTTGQDVKAAALTIALGQPATFDRILIQEAIQLGQHVRSFTVEAWDGKDWQSFAVGTTIGHKRLLRVKEITTARVRLVIRDARAAPAISEFGLFKASPRDRSAP